MKLLKWLEVAGRVLLAGVLIVGNVIMNVIGLIIGAITRKNNPQVNKLEQSLKLREREYAIEQIGGKTMRSDTKNQSVIFCEMDKSSMMVAEIKSGGLNAIYGKRILYL